MSIMSRRISPLALAFIAWGLTIPFYATAQEAALLRSVSERSPGDVVIGLILSALFLACYFCLLVGCVILFRVLRRRVSRLIKQSVDKLGGPEVKS